MLSPVATPCFPSLRRLQQEPDLRRPKLGAEPRDEQRVRQQPAIAIIEGDSGLITGSFDAEHEHRRILPGLPATDLCNLGRGKSKIRALFPSDCLGKKFHMPIVKVKENEPFDVALRRFKRSCEKAGVLSEVRRREFYEKPTSVRKRKAAAAVKRHAKKLQRESRRFEKAF